MQLPLNIRWNAAAELDRFVPGENDTALRLVTDLADGVLEAPALYLHGPHGVGKSHLLQGACRRVTSAGGVAVYLPLDQLLGHGAAVLDGWEQAQLIALDDLDALHGRDEWQGAVFHLYNRVVERGGRLLFAGQRPPAELPLELPDLRSRLGWGPVVAVREPDEATCLAILRQRAAQRGLELPDATARYLIRRLPRELPGLLAFFETLDRASLAAGRRLTVPFVREILAERSRLDADTSGRR
ncbi:DnaA regulatory inactivator Hda [Halorhodospira halophila]|uniref:DnaA regulatory inactivator Hda n=1 Tax=Halorhodospira TaxID=85108 RepID=UPI001EE9782E|nr:DnaA regulatory inactivator Hda [Halorhodospira halophila]MCG5543810.1 DnaA regulatory inactivator Hda [Halorhodospira sp. 9628]